MKSTSGAISTVVVASLMVLLAIATITLMVQPSANRYSFNIHNSMKLIKSNLEINIDDAQGWAFTVADTTNASMGCLRAHSDCSALAGIKSPLVTIRDTVDNIYLGNLDSATQGVTLAGKSCTNFSATDGNSTCPVKVSVTWTPVCPGGPCIDPSYLVEVNFDYSSAKDRGPKIDLTKYGFVLQK